MRSRVLLSAARRNHVPSASDANRIVLIPSKSQQLRDAIASAPRRGALTFAAVTGPQIETDPALFYLLLEKSVDMQRSNSVSTAADSRTAKGFAR
jgi:hypothetical protein